MIKRIAATALFSLVFAATALAQDLPPPADSSIKNAYYDLDRYTKQFETTPSANSAKRILRLLTLTEGRLKGSKNQSDPSYKAAADGLAALRERLTATAEGRPAPAQQQAAPQQQQQQPQQQQQQQAPAAAQSSDPAVQQAAAEIARISGLVDTMQPGDKANGRQYLDELKAVGNQLRGVAKKDEAWSQAARDYNELQKRILEVANAPAPAGGGQTAQPSGGGQQPAASAKADPQTERAMRELKFVERNVNNLRGDDVRYEQKILAELKRIGEMLGGIKDRSHPSWQEALEFRAALYEKLAYKRLGSIAKQLDDIEAAVNRSSSVEFLNPDVLNNVNNAVANLARQAEVYGFYRDKAEFFADKPEIQGVFEKPEQIAALMDKRAAEARAAEGDLGDVTAEVDAIEARMKAREVPRTLNGQHITLALAQAYVADMQKVQAEVKQDMAYLLKIEGKTDKIDKQRMSRLKAWVGGDAQRKIDDSLQQSRSIFEHGWSHHQRTLDWHAASDPTDPNHQSNRYLGENVYEENLKRLAEVQDWAQAAMVFEAAYGPDRKAEREQQLAAAEQALAKYEQDYVTAVNAVRLKVGVDDDELREIAREVLESGRYEEIGEIVRIETGKKSRRKETRGSISGTTTGASINASVYEWDEFQARTIEKVGDRYFIFANNIKYFYSGGTKTPLDRWLLSGRFKSNPILEENIHKTE